MCHSCSLLLNFLKYKAGFLDYEAGWSRLHSLFYHHPPCLQEFQIFKVNSPWFWCFSNPECTIRFSSFQVHADFVAPNLICWCWLQCMASQHHSLHTPVVMLCTHTVVGKVKIWPLRVKQAWPSLLPSRFAKYLFPVYVEKSPIKFNTLKFSGKYDS